MSQEEIIEQLSVPRYAPRLKPTTIPSARWNEEPLFCLSVNDEWISHILGVLTALDQPDTWLGTKAEIYDARQQVNEIMLAFMEHCDPMNNCCPEPLTRLTEDGGMEVSYDGGMTWQAAITEDPRNTAPQLPPLSGADGSDKRCRAANNVVRQLKELQTGWAHNLGAGLTVLQLALTFAASAAAIFLTAGGLAPVLVPALLTLAAGVVGTGEEAYNDLFTTDVWDFVLCQAYCECEPDGTYTSTAFNNILANCDSHFSGTLALAFSGALTSWQLAGLNQAAKIPSTDNLDCDACDCGTCGCGLENWHWDDVLGGDSYASFERNFEACEIYADSYFNGSNYYFCVHAAAEECCVSCLALVSGTITGPVFHSPCDYTGPLTASDEVTGWVNDPLSLPCGAPFRGFLVRSSTPFTVKVGFTS